MTKSKMKDILALSMAMAAMSSGIDNSVYHDAPRNLPEPRRVANRKKVSGLKHIGAIPKGCKLAKVDFEYPFTRNNVDYKIHAVIEIVAMNDKSFNQKLVKKQKEILQYVFTTSIEDLQADSLIQLI
jgi:hypothetical protein